MVKLEKLSSTQKRVVDSNKSMSSHLYNVWNIGSSYTPRSWLYEKRIPQTVLDEWIIILESEIKPHPYSKTILHFEKGYISKFGPQGGRPPLKDEMVLFDTQYSQSTEPELFETDLWKQSVDATRIKIFGNTKNRRPKSTNSVIAEMRNKGKLATNAGWPSFSKRNKEQTIKQAILDGQDRNWLSFPALILLRNQFGKNRIIWMFPFATNVEENRYIFPLMDLARKHANVNVTPWEGILNVKQILTKIWIPGSRAVGGDISAMDGNFKRYHSDQVFKCTSPIFQSIYRDDFKTLFDNLHNIEVLVSPDDKVVGPHGVASGSGFTQFDETIFQCIFLEYLGRIGLVLGDDSCIIYPDEDNSRAREIVNAFQSVGLPANIDKQSDAKDHVVFLQRLFIRYVMSREDKNVLAGIYSTIRALTSMMFPERFYSPDEFNSDIFCIRIFMILENCVDSPVFEKFCEFVAKGQKDLIPFAKKTSSELDKLWKDSKSINDLVPSYNQEKLDSKLSSFASILYVSQL